MVAVAAAVATMMMIVGNLPILLCLALIDVKVGSTWVAVAVVQHLRSFVVVVVVLVIDGDDAAVAVAVAVAVAS